VKLGLCVQQAEAVDFSGGKKSTRDVAVRLRGECWVTGCGLGRCKLGWKKGNVGKKGGRALGRDRGKRGNFTRVVGKWGGGGLVLVRRRSGRKGANTIRIKDKSTEFLDKGGNGEREIATTPRTDNRESRRGGF